jgi:hypothetical protein
MVGTAESALWVNSSASSVPREIKSILNLDVRVYGVASTVATLAGDVRPTTFTPRKALPCFSTTLAFLPLKFIDGFQTRFVSFYVLQLKSAPLFPPAPIRAPTVSGDPAERLNPLH